MLSPEDRARAAVIERLMCDYEVDFGAIAHEMLGAEDALDDAIAPLDELQTDGVSSARTGASQCARRRGLRAPRRGLLRRLLNEERARTPWRSEVQRSRGRMESCQRPSSSHDNPRT